MAKGKSNNEKSGKKAAAKSLKEKRAAKKAKRRDRISKENASSSDR